MYNLSEAVEEKGIETGIEQGIKQGRLETLFSLVHDKVLKSEEAARRADMSKEEFVRLMEQKYRFIKAELNERNFVQLLLFRFLSSGRRERVWRQV